MGSKKRASDEPGSVAASSNRWRGTANQEAVKVIVSSARHVMKTEYQTKREANGKGGPRA
jgi:hypothetical protein